MAPTEDGSRRVRYVNPVDAGAVMPTIDCYAQRFDAGRTTRPYRTSATAIVVVVEGEGSSRVGAKQFAWRKNDIFTLPRWQWIEHSAGAGPASMFFMTDRSFVENIGHLREERKMAVSANEPVLRSPD
jgi:gentisate 1,2-dioxygenase